MGRKRRQSERLSGAALLAQALERYSPMLPAEEYPLLLRAVSEPLSPAVRINPLKVDPPVALAEWSARYGWHTQNVPFCPSGWWLRDCRVPPSQTIEHRFGQYYIQEAASMLPAQLFNFADLPYPLVLDLAASPGGKTTHLIDRMDDRGFVIANDASAARITALRLVLQTWGATGVAVTCFPGERFGEWMPETFDRVLLDAPCSMEGLRTSETHPMRAISEGERQRLAQRQLRLLESALRAARVGGEIVYATCTLAPEENEAVLDALLQRYPHAVEIVDLASRLSAPAAALTRHGERHYHPAVQRAVRLWPHHFGCAGFFAALLLKHPLRGHEYPLRGHEYPLRGHEQAALLSDRTTTPTRPTAGCDFQPLLPAETARLSGELLQNFGFEIHPHLERLQLALRRRGDTVIAVPQIYLSRFSAVPVQALGLSLGNFSAGGFVPSHEWVSRFHAFFRAGRVRIGAEHLSPWLRGEDVRLSGVATSGGGAIVLVEDEEGRFIGRGKQLRDRLKNLLPRRAVL